MKQFEYRETKGFCRLCECVTHGKAVVIPCRLSGKSVQMILCDSCVKYLNAYIDTAKQEAK